MLKRRMLNHSFFISITFIVLWPNITFAGVNNDFTILKNLNQEWMVYDQDRTSYVPYVLQTPFRTSSISFMLDLAGNKEYILQCCIQKGTSLFIDQKIISKFNEAGCHQYSIDSLYKTYGKESVFITLFNPSLKREKIKTLIVDEVKLLQDQEQANVLTISRREFSGFKDFFILGILFILIFMAALYNLYPKSFNDFHNVGKVFSFKLRDESIIASRPVSTVNLLFILMYCVMLAFLIIVIWQQIGGVPNSFGFINLSNLGNLSLSLILFTLLIFLAVIVKYILISAMSRLFDMKAFSTIHFFDFIRMSLMFMIFLLVMTTFLLLTFNSLPAFAFKWIIYFIVFFAFIIVLMLFFKLLSTYSFRNIHLFSYLCTTEILPMLIGFKFFLDL